MISISESTQEAFQNLFLSFVLQRSQTSQNVYVTHYTLSC